MGESGLEMVSNTNQNNNMYISFYFNLLIEIRKSDNTFFSRQKHRLSRTLFEILLCIFTLALYL